MNTMGWIPLNGARHCFLVNIKFRLKLHIRSEQSHEVKAWHLLSAMSKWMQFGQQTVLNLGPVKQDSFVVLTTYIFLQVLKPYEMPTNYNFIKQLHIYIKALNVDGAWRLWLYWLAANASLFFFFFILVRCKY